MCFRSCVWKAWPPCSGVRQAHGPCRPGRIKSICPALILLVCLAAIGRAGWTAAAEPQFYRAINLGGPDLEIEGRLFEADDAQGFECQDARFENQAVPLVPAVEGPLASMLRSSRWSPAGTNRMVVHDVPEGTYTVYLYVWEDNDSQTFDVLLNGRVVAGGVISGQAGYWQRLGPWTCTAGDGRIEIRTHGGHANCSGLEIWRGEVVLPAVDASGHFDRELAPLLAARCLGCHNPSERKGGLDLTSRTGALQGGESGAAVVPGNPEESLLIRRLRAGEMPPAGELPGDQIEMLAEWIRGGATWGTDPIDPFLRSSDTRAGYDWWAFQPVVWLEPPEVADASWCRNPIDRFILGELERAGIQPSPEADRRTLIRRLSFDLVGLPPETEEVEAFVANGAPDAYERLVDRLLDSPHFGERWARRWLDIVRFGESQGFERNKLRPNAWRYRDWVVEAFNADLPYDDFVRWQIAGDILRPNDPLAVLASSYLVVGPYDLTAYTDGTPNMRRAAREEEIEGLVGNVAQTFLGLTVNCGRCHDHKYDPISQRDYYSFAAALAGTYHGDEREYVAEETRQQTASRRAELAAERDRLREQAAGEPDPLRRRRLEAAASRAQSVLRLLEGGPAHLNVPKDPGVVHVLARGDFRQPRQPVPPCGLPCLTGLPPDFNLPVDAPDAERRAALARWLTDPRNPLPARVIANRLWAWHFGRGLAPSPNDLGFLGGKPTHPQLLDWLAWQLASPDQPQPWSLKRLHRLIVTSATYRQSSYPTEQAAQLDPENRLWSRFERRRLEAEELRDAVLAVSGQLDRTIGGPGYRDFTSRSSSQNEIYEVFDAVGAEFNRRTLYRTWLRSGTSPLLDVFDCPDPSVSVPRRSATVTPLQALTLLNNTFFEQQAASWAERLQAARGELRSQIELAWLHAAARPPDETELAVSLRLAEEHGLSQLCLVLFNTNAFVYLD